MVQPSFSNSLAISGTTPSELLAGKVVAATAVRHRWPSTFWWAMSRPPAGT